MKGIFIGLTENIALLFSWLSGVLFCYLLSRTLKRNKTQNHLLQSDARYRCLVENSQDFIFSLDLSGRIMSVNRKVCQEMGLDINEIVGLTLSEFFVIERNFEKWNLALQEVVATCETVEFENECLLPSNVLRSYRNILSPLFDRSGSLVGITGTSHDITKFIGREKQIEKLAFYDSLTNLPNKLQLTRQLEQVIEEANDGEAKIALVLLDIDHFKKVNDLTGHYMGDTLLKEVAARLNNCITVSDWLARAGGDAFVILNPRRNRMDEVHALLKKITDVFEQPFFAGGHKLFLRMSVGITVYPEHGTTGDELLNNAYSAMFKAKELGRNTNHWYERSMTDAATQKMMMKQHLLEALNNQEFTLVYQPQVELWTGNIRGVEALIRWNSPHLGFISPGDFIHLAEETGLILSIGEWTLRHACERSQKWREFLDKDMIISVNVSAIQLKQKDFAAVVERVLQETGLDPKLLELEITESMLIESFDTALPILSRLKDLGVNIALDDFGTGYSSLNYLKLLPIHVVKIDKSFIQNIHLYSAEQAIVEAIITLVQKLHLKVIAEGIETQQQLDYLKHCGCDFVQGYLLGKPVPEEEIVRLLERGKIEYCVLQQNLSQNVKE